MRIERRIKSSRSPADSSILNPQSSIPPTAQSIQHTAPAVALTSAAALAYEILLIRLFSIVEWHHLAFLIISLALLGYGASGTLLALAREPLLRHFHSSAAIAAGAFGATSLGAFLIAQRIELNSLEIFWSTRQFGRLFVLYLVFAVPFFCAATAIGLALTKYGADSPRLYRADLLGGGISAAAATAILFFVHPVTALQLVAILGFIAAALFTIPEELRGTPRNPRNLALGIVLIGSVAVIAARPLALPLRMSQFKELSHAMRVPGARVVDERSSPHGLLTTVISPAVPFRHAPGLSLAFAGDIPEQIAVFTDGGGMTPIVRYSGNPSSVEYLDYLPTAIAYHAGTRKQRVAIIGAGGGSEVLSALVHGAHDVTAVELNPQMVELMAKRFARESGGLYSDRRVRVVTAEARRFIRESRAQYDAIQLALVGSHGASAAGVGAISESYLYTVEAMTELIEHLRPGGYLVLTRWMQAPPREVVKLLATAIEAQERLGANPANRLALVRGWNTATLVVKNGDFAAGELAAIREFCDDRSLDIDYAPGVQRDQTNQFNVLDEPYLFDAATALLAGERSRADFFARYKFNVRPATDERPYFFHSFRWSALPELLQLRARGGMPLLEWGYLVLIAGLAQALVASIALILLPLLFARRGRAEFLGIPRVPRSSSEELERDPQSLAESASPLRGTPRNSEEPRNSTSEPTWRLVVYFGAIGLAFLFVEIAFMQRLTLFLGQPLYAIAVVLSSFLVFGGLGSGASARVDDRRARLIPFAVAAIALVALLIARALPTIALALPDAAKIAISIAVVAPLAFAMGMPFPLGLRRLAATDETAIPWAWAINGTASVLSSMLATVIAVHFGFSALVAVAAALYALAASGVPHVVEDRHSCLSPP